MSLGQKHVFVGREIDRISAAFSHNGGISPGKKHGGTFLNFAAVGFKSPPVFETRRTRSHTPDIPPCSCEELTRIALALRSRVALNAKQRFRLVGVGLSNFRDSEHATAQPMLFG